jgi:hypothetical protein
VGLGEPEREYSGRLSPLWGGCSRAGISASYSRLAAVTIERQVRPSSLCGRPGLGLPGFASWRACRLTARPGCSRFVYPSPDSTGQPYGPGIASRLWLGRNLERNREAVLAQKEHSPPLQELPHRFPASVTRSATFFRHRSKVAVTEPYLAVPTGAVMQHTERPG